MKIPVSKEVNRDNLLYTVQLIHEIDYYPFYGTLLGLVREDDIIEGDDDIDFYVNINEREKLISILKLNFIVVDETLSVNKNKSFLQVFRFYNNVKFIIDFYFYDSNKDKFNIIEKWNFEGGTHIQSKHLRIPKIFIYPIKSNMINGHQLFLPSQPVLLCEFLYGPNWNLKMKKDEEYLIKVINNKPVLFKIKKNFFGIKKIILD